MSRNTKYTAARQCDSLDETRGYSQAPPAYVDESPFSADQAALLGGPRSSEDNIPDDFKASRYLQWIWRRILIGDLVRWLCCRGDD